MSEKKLEEHLDEADEVEIIAGEEAMKLMIQALGFDIEEDGAIVESGSGEQAVTRSGYDAYADEIKAVVQGENGPVFIDNIVEFSDWLAENEKMELERDNLEKSEADA